MNTRLHEYYDFMIAYCLRVEKSMARFSPLTLNFIPVHLPFEPSGGYFASRLYVHK